MLSDYTKTLKKDLLACLETRKTDPDNYKANMREFSRKYPEGHSVDIEELKRQIRRYMDRQKMQEPRFLVAQNGYYAYNYPSDIDNVGEQKLPLHFLAITSGNLTYNFSLGTSNKDIPLISLLWDVQQQNYTKLLRENPDIVDYIFEAYQQSNIKNAGNYRDYLIARLIKSKEEQRAIKAEIRANDKKLPLKERVSNKINDFLHR